MKNWNNTIVLLVPIYELNYSCVVCIHVKIIISTVTQSLKIIGQEMLKTWSGIGIADGPTDGCMVGWMDGWMDGWVLRECVGGLMDRWTDRGMDGDR